MYSLIALFTRLASAKAQVQPDQQVALNLMERADAGAGRNSREAEELRGAALAYLSVVR